MNANELRELALRDIQLPEPVSWWPPGYGWWLLASVLLLCALAVLARRSPARSRTARTRTIAMRELDAVEASYRATGDARAAAAAMSVLLRRFALELAPRAQVAAITGERWQDWIRNRCDVPGAADTAAVLAGSAYRPEPELDVTALLAGCRAFVEAARANGHDT